MMMLIMVFICTSQLAWNRYLAADDGAVVVIKLSLLRLSFSMLYVIPLGQFGASVVCVCS